MPKIETIDKLAAVIQEITCGQRLPLPDENLTDYGVDSLDTVEIAMEAEELFGIEIDDAEFEYAQTTTQIAALVEKLLENAVA